MPGRFYGRRGSRLGRIVDSNKNIISSLTPVTTGANAINTIALAVDSATNTTVNEVTRGSKIFRIWAEITYNTTATSIDGVTNAFEAYIIKNPGANLTPPNPGSVGSSNEKKFVFKMWRSLAGPRSEGWNAYVWKGWLKVPKVYQRMGADDTIAIVSRAIGVDGIFCNLFVYKWFK